MKDLKVPEAKYPHLDLDGAHKKSPDLDARNIWFETMLNSQY
jgi:hypothetical protein